MRAALFLAAGAQAWLTVRGFVTPPTGSSIISEKTWVPHPCTAVADYPEGSSADFISEGTRDVREQLREAIWKATDAVVRAVDDMPRIKHGDTLARLGKLVEDVDDKYFAKYRGMGVTNNYLDSLSPKIREVIEEAGTAASTETSSESGEKAEGPDPPSASAEAPVVELPPTDEVSAEASVPDAEATPGADEPKGTSGTVKLDRPKPVQGVFDELQKKAVEYYKQGPGFGKKKPAESPAAPPPVPESVKLAEAKLEGLLNDCKFKPRALANGERAELIEALKSLEESYPKDATPLSDPALRGEWTLVYCSSGNLMAKVLRGLLSRLFVMSSPSQMIDTRASSVTNACRMRLRLTRWQLGRLSQRGTYRVSEIGGESALRKVEVTFPKPVKRSWWRRALLPRLNTEDSAGKIQAEVTYLSGSWRICRTTRGVFAFRKNP